jgi:hypothetical protein
MVLVDTAGFAHINPNIPRRMYMNHMLKEPLLTVLDQLARKKLIAEIKTWDGLFNVRYQRGSRTKLSRHSWGLAIDMNAAMLFLLSPLCSFSHPSSPYATTA